VTEDDGSGAKPPPVISRNVRVLGLVSFLTDTSSEMLYPIIPLYLTEVLLAPMGAVGLIEGLAEATANVLKGVSGRLADRAPRRMPFLFAGYGLAAAAKPLLALAGSWPGVLAARMIDRTGKGLRGPARDAVIVESTPPGSRGAAFGWHRAADTVGAVAGPLVGLALLHWSTVGYRGLFWLAAVPATAGVLCLLAVREAPSRRSQATPTATVAPASMHAPPFAAQMSGPGVDDTSMRRFLLVVALFSIGNSSNAFLLLRARDLGWSATAVILLYVAYNLTYSAVAGPAGRLSDRYGRRVVLTVGLVTAAFVYAGFAIAPDRAWAAVLLPLYGAYAGAFGGAGRALVADLAPPERIASALGTYQMITGLGVLVASVSAGVLWSRLGASAPFYFGAATSLLAAVAMLGVPAPQLSGRRAGLP
jgi:MFS family permease